MGLTVFRTHLSLTFSSAVEILHLDQAPWQTRIVLDCDSTRDRVSQAKRGWFGGCGSNWGRHRRPNAGLFARRSGIVSHNLGSAPCRPPGHGSLYSENYKPTLAYLSASHRNL